VPPKKNGDLGARGDGEKVRGRPRRRIALPEGVLPVWAGVEIAAAISGLSRTRLFLLAANAAIETVKVDGRRLWNIRSTLRWVGQEAHRVAIGREPRPSLPVSALPSEEPVGAGLEAGQ